MKANRNIHRDSRFRRLCAWLIFFWMVYIQIAFYGTVFWKKGIPRILVFFSQRHHGKQ